MNDRSRVVSETVLGKNEEGTEILKVEVMFRSGRYIVAVRRVTREAPRSYGGVTLVSESFGMFDSASEVIENVPRFNAKRLAVIMPDPEVVARLTAKVMAEKSAIS